MSNANCINFFNFTPVQLHEGDHEDKAVPKRWKHDLITSIVLMTLTFLGAAFVAGLLGVNTLPFELTRGFEHVAGTLSTLFKPYIYGLAAASVFFLFKSGLLRMQDI